MRMNRTPSKSWYIWFKEGGTQDTDRRRSLHTKITLRASNVLIWPHEQPKRDCNAPINLGDRKSWLRYYFRCLGNALFSSGLEAWFHARCNDASLRGQCRRLERIIVRERGNRKMKCKKLKSPSSPVLKDGARLTNFPSLYTMTHHKSAISKVSPQLVIYSFDPATRQKER